MEQPKTYQEVCKLLKHPGLIHIVLIANHIAGSEDYLFITRQDEGGFIANGKQDVMGKFELQWDEEQACEGIEYFCKYWPTFDCSWTTYNPGHY